MGLKSPFFSRLTLVKLIQFFKNLYLNWYYFILKIYIHWVVVQTLYKIFPTDKEDTKPSGLANFDLGIK